LLAVGVFRDEDIPMNDTTYFERLSANIMRLVHHPGFADKRQAIELCMEDVDDLRLDGRITAEQAGVLRQALRASLGQAA
jgi:hypothetical protein